MLCCAAGCLILYSHTYPEINCHKEIQLPENALSQLHRAMQLDRMILYGYRHEFLYDNVIQEVVYVGDWPITHEMTVKDYLNLL